MPVAKTIWTGVSVQLEGGLREKSHTRQKLQIGLRWDRSPRTSDALSAVIALSFWRNAASR
jgi:hypothetical protein